MTALVRDGKIKKYYKTLIKGHLKNKKGTIKNYIINKENKKQLAITHYEVEKEYEDSSLLNIRLETGRTHQIRKHFAMLSHPIAMDKKYGDFSWNKTLKFKRQFLHASRLTFIHTENNTKVDVKSSLPQDLKL